MENAQILNLINENHLSIIIGLITSMFLMCIIIIYLFQTVNHLKSRYNKMMTGTQTGTDFETMLLAHIKKTDTALLENELLRKKNLQLETLLNTSITKVGIVRFRAFKDMGSDLSYAVALLNEHHDGIVFSSIFGREDSRSYVKPITEGKCSKYTISVEEEEAIQKAIKTPFQM